MFSFLRRDTSASKKNAHASDTSSSAALIPKSELTTLRADFPFLSANTKNFIYVDNACMSLRPQVVIDAITRYYTHYSSCAGRSNHKLSRELDLKIHEARATVAKFVGAKYADEIIFTRNATEAINLVAHTLQFDVGDIVLTSDKEHNSNLVPWLSLVKEKGIVHKVIPAQKDGSFSIDQLEQLFSQAKKDGQKIKLVSVGHVSNLDGSSIDIAGVVACAHKHAAYVLVDGCQAVGHIPVELHKLGVDFYAFSAHKMCGPSGMGALYATLAVQKELSQFIVGGQTVVSTTYTSYVAQSGPSKFEAGLQDYAGILGFAAACEYLRKIGVSNIESHVTSLNAQLTALLDDEITRGTITLLGARDAQRRGGVFSFVVPNMSATEFASLLDKTYGIAVRGGQHCAHSWFAAHDIEGSIRISFYLYNTSYEVEQIAAAIKSLIHLAATGAN